MFGRGKRSRSHRQRLWNELAQSYGHLRLAAGHAAGGAAESLTTPYDKAGTIAARGWSTTKSAFSPLYDQVRDGAANARREHMMAKRRSRWPALVGLLAAGAAIGAAGAMFARRRRSAEQWHEYEPVPGIDDVGFGSESGIADAAKDRVSATTKKVAAGAAAVADTVSAKAGKIADSLHEKVDAAETTADTRDEAPATAARASGAGSFTAYASTDDAGANSTRA